MEDQPNVVICMRPKQGKYAELASFLSTTLKEIREGVPGIIHAYEFPVAGKDEFIVLEKFYSNRSMFNYFNSDYHAGLVEKLMDFAEDPVDMKTSANLDDLNKFMDGSQGKHFVPV